MSEPVALQPALRGCFGPDADGDWIVDILGPGLAFAVADEEKARAIVAAIEATQTEPLELLPCPFCGSDSICWCDTTPEGQHWFDCDECGCEGPARDFKVEAIAAWNTRTQTDQQLKEALERAAENFDRLVAPHMVGSDVCDFAIEAAKQARSSLSSSSLTNG